MSARPLRLVGGGCDLRLAGGRVVPADPSDRPPAEDVLSADGMTVLPGWVDLQVNGAFGIDLTSDPAAVWELARHLPATGVTAFLPTLVSPDPDTVTAAISAWHDGPPPDWSGAAPLGWHIEGPFIAPSHRGTHPSTSLRPIDVKLLRTWAASGAVRMVTLAPELPGADEAIAVLRAAGVVIAIGHTAATTEDVARAVDAGASAVTHLFNAMPPLHHRDPGLVGVALTDPRLALGVIADGLHVDPRVLRLIDRAAGADRIHLVTDSMGAAGVAAAMGHGRHRLGDLDVVVSDDGPRNADGGLAGSAATYDRVVRTWRQATGADPAGLAQVTSVTAATLLGEVDRGHLRPGARADITAIDGHGRVVLTVIGGEVRHRVDPEGRHGHR